MTDPGMQPNVDDLRRPLLTVCLLPAALLESNDVLSLSQMFQASNSGEYH